MGNPFVRIGANVAAWRKFASANDRRVQLSTTIDAPRGIVYASIFILPIVVCNMGHRCPKQ